MTNTDKSWDFHITWQKPEHTAGLSRYLVYRQNIGKIDRSGVCSVAGQTTKEDCLIENGEWIDACTENRLNGDLIKVTNNISELEVYDTVHEPGIWRYSVYAVFERHASQFHTTSEEPFVYITMCSTNTFFIRETFTTTVISEHGTVIGSFRNLEGEFSEIEISAIEYGYSFTGWSSDDYTFSEPLSRKVKVLMNQNLTLTANYEPIKYSLNISGYNGQVNEVNSGEYNYLQQVEIEATQSEHNLFIGWQGENILDITSASTSVTILKDTDVKGLFSNNKYNLTLLHTGEGSVVGAGRYEYGDLIQLYAKPGYDATSKEPYFFTQWEIQSGSLDSVAGQDIGVYTDQELLNQNAFKERLTVTISEDTTLEGAFMQKRFTLGVTSNTINAGVQSGSGSYYPGQQVAVQANAKEGYQFNNWEIKSGAGSFGSVNSQSTVFTTSSADTIIVANYDLINYQLRLYGPGEEVILSTGSRLEEVSFNIGDSFDIEAVPLAGYEFSHWEVTFGQGVLSDKDSSQTTLTCGAGDINIQAYYEASKYTVSIAGNAGVQYINDKLKTIDVEENENIEIHSLTQPGYNWISWRLEGSGSIQDASLESTIFNTGNSNAKLYANYEIINYSLAVDESETSAGNAYIKAGDGSRMKEDSVNLGDKIEIYYSTNIGFKFLGWELSGPGDIQKSNSNIYNHVDGVNKAQDDGAYIVTIGDGNAIATAVFEPINYKINIDGENSETYIIYNSDQVDGVDATDQTTFTIVCNPNPGFVFGSWVVNGAGVIDDESSATTSFTSGIGSASIRANVYSRKAIYLYSEPSGGGSLLSLDGNYKVYGDSVTIEATTEVGFSLGSGWEVLYKNNPSRSITLEPGTSDASLKFTMVDDDVIVTKSFIPQNYTVNIVVNGGGAQALNLSGNVITSYSTQVNTAVVLRKRVNSTHEFISWSSSDITISDEDSLADEISFNMPAQNITITINTVEWGAGGIDSAGNITASTLPDTRTVSSITDSSGTPVPINMVRLGPAIFLQGSPASELGRGNNEKQFTQRIESAYYLSTTEMTQKQYESLMDYNPSLNVGENLPVENITWQDLTKFCNKLTDLERSLNLIPKNWGYCVPNESEWEYACRGGATTRYYSGDSIAPAGTHTYEQVQSAIASNVEEVQATSYSGTSYLCGQVQRPQAFSNTTYFIKNDKTLWGVGANIFGKLADPDTSLKISSPKQIDSNVEQFSAGPDHLVYRKTDGSLWGLGAARSFGILDVNKIFDGRQFDLFEIRRYESSPYEIESSGVEFCHAGYHTTFYVKNDRLYATGNNRDGQLGLFDDTNNQPLKNNDYDHPFFQESSIYIYEYRMVGIDTIAGDDSWKVLPPKDYITSPHSKYLATNMKQMASCSGGTLMLMNNGKMFGSGRWVAGSGSTWAVKNQNLPSMFSISAGRDHFSAVRKQSTAIGASKFRGSGKVYSIGAAWFGQLGVGINSITYQTKTMGWLEVPQTGSISHNNEVEGFMSFSGYWHHMIKGLDGTTGENSKLWACGKYFDTHNFFSYYGRAIHKYPNFQEITLTGGSIKHASGGANYTMIVYDNGDLVGIGDNIDGNLGFSNTVTYLLNNDNTGIGTTVEVGQYTPNTFGLFDMMGNVDEWTLDNYQADVSYPLENTFINQRVAKGGSFLDKDDDCRIASRKKYSSRACFSSEKLGFRLCLRRFDDAEKAKWGWNVNDNDC
jgi:formylglycine-generating enzyme required for sulfatase activity